MFLESSNAVQQSKLTLALGAALLFHLLLLSMLPVELHSTQAKLASDINVTLLANLQDNIVPTPEPINTSQTSAKPDQPKRERLQSTILVRKKTPAEPQRLKIDPATLAHWADEDVKKSLRDKPSVSR